MELGFGAATGGVIIKINIGKAIVMLMMLLVLGFAFYFVDSFTGNPVSAFVAYHKIKAYSEIYYPTLGLELSKVKYNFKNNAYSCLAQAKKSEDTKFRIGYSHGRVSDDYEYEVANHFTTYRRLSKEFNDRVKGIIEKGYPYETTLIIGDLIGDTQKLAPDKPLDLKNIPLQLSLTVYVLSDVQNEEQMAASLLKLHQLMLAKDIRIDQYTIRLEEPMPEKSKPGSGSNLYLENFPAGNISEDQEILTAAIRKHQLDSNEDNKR